MDGVLMLEIVRNLIVVLLIFVTNFECERKREMGARYGSLR